MRHLLILALIGCGDKDTDETTDADGDGYDVDSDCDDSDASAYPGGTELCDGVDNNCDGTIDEDATDAVTTYADADGDGFGDASAATTGCTAPAGDVSDNTDCDDTDASAFPGGTEICDGADNDCNGTIDDETTDGAIYYEDADADSYGNADSELIACEEPAGYSADDTDCDDTDASTNPDATEICGDGVDNDCDGTPNHCRLTGEYEDADADFSYAGSGDYTQIGYALASGDANNDGFGDALIGGRFGGTDNVGELYIFYGSASGLSASPDVTLSGENNSDNFSGDVAAGDVNGDGHTDVLVGAYGYPSTAADGRAYLFLGPVTADADTTDAAAVIDADDSGSYTGWRVLVPGDVNDDGINDALVTAPGGSYQINSSGEAALFYGPVTGTLSLADADARLYGMSRDDWTGGAISTVGDVNGDGVADLSISAEASTVNSSEEGRVFVVHGPVSGDVSLAGADAIYTGASTDDFAGWAQSSGDANNDGYPDLWISSPAPDNNTGAAWLVLGPLSGGEQSLAGADAMLIGESANDLAGHDISAAGDLDGDGFADVAIGAYLAPAGDSKGIAYALYGPFSGSISLADADLTISGTHEGAALGWAVEILHNIDGDGDDELLLGAYIDSYVDIYNGAVYLFEGQGM